MVKRISRHSIEFLSLIIIIGICINLANSTTPNDKTQRPETREAITFATSIESAAEELAVPNIKDGQTQVIPEFKDPDLWIRHDL